MNVKAIELLHTTDREDSKEHLIKCSDKQKQLNNIATREITTFKWYSLRTAIINLGDPDLKVHHHNWPSAVRILAQPITFLTDIHIVIDVMTVWDKSDFIYVSIYFSYNYKVFFRTIMPAPHHLQTVSQTFPVSKYIADLSLWKQNSHTIYAKYNHSRRHLSEIADRLEEPTIYFDWKWF